MYMEYEHTQRGWFHYLAYLLAGVLLAIGLAIPNEPVVTIVLAANALVMVIFARMFATLTVRDEGQWLAIRFGPLPLLRGRVRYANITDVRPDRTSGLDGWGIHWIPWYGTTYNLWGFDCVRLQVGKRVVRVGTDDVENLVRFLRGKIGQPNPGQQDAT